jgi:hypothetical protein
MHGKPGVVALDVHGPALADRQAESVQSVRQRFGDDRFEQHAAHGRSMEINELYAYVAVKLQQVSAGEGLTAAARSDR